MARRRSWVSVACATGLVLSVASAARAQEDFPGDKGRDDWRNDFVVYMWAVNQDVDLTVGMTRVPLDVSFGDLWDIMKFSASGHYEGHKGDWGLMLDFSYANLGEDAIRPRSMTARSWPARATTGWG